MVQQQVTAISQKRLTFLTSIGAGLEYYDFVIYALLASYLSRLFFPHSDPTSALLETFAIFAVGYVVRPVGGIIFGIIGDKFGRKKTFLAAILLMTAATTAMGLLPTYIQIGVAASFLLMFLRMLQGLSFGAELPGALTFLSEHVGKSYRGTYCSFLLASVSLGSCMGALVNYVLAKILTVEQMAQWGWRVPFLIGASLGLVGYWLRRKTHETPLFLHMQQNHRQTNTSPFFLLLTVFKKYLHEVLQGIGISLFSACFIIFALYLPAYLHEYFQYALSDVFLAATIGLFWSAILLPIFGRLSDKIGRKQLLFIATLLFSVFGYFMFHLLDYRHISALLLFVLLYYTFTSALAVCYFTMLAELFPTEVRYTGTALCYNTVYSIAGFTPVIASYLIKLTASLNSIIVFLIVLSLTTVLTIPFIKNQTGQELA